MSSPTEQLADQAIAKLDADDAAKGGDDAKNNDDKGGQSAQGTDDKGAGAAANDGEGDQGGGKADDDAGKGDEGKSDDKGKFTADDGLEVDDPNAGAAQQQQTPAQQLTPGAQKYIADNIGEPIVIRGVQGEGDDAKQVELKVYTPNDIPTNFKFLNDRELAAAQTGFYGLEQKANKLLQDYQQQDANNAAQDFERRENEGIKADVADLQKSGAFPMFTKRPGEAGFNDTPEAKQMQEVLDVMSEQNAKYMQQYQQGRPYKHIGFAEAFDMWRSKNPAQQARKKANDEQDKEDEARKKAAERSDANRGMGTSKITKPTVRSGSTVRDVLRRLDAED